MWCTVVVNERVTLWDWGPCIQVAASKHYYTGHKGYGTGWFLSRHAMAVIGVGL